MIKKDTAEKPKAKYRKFIIAFWSLLFLGVAIPVLFFVGIALGWFGFMPTFEELENPKSNLATEIYSADSVLLGKYFIENRSNVHFQELSPNLVNALKATEDIRFETHSGVDGRAIMRVVFGLLTGNHKGGGSTITQQLAKNLFPRGQNLSTPQLVLKKFKEWVTAIKLERNYSKQEIMAMYFNTVDFGSQSFGVKSAARTYFSKEPSELSINEAALLVGILKAPTWYSPVRNPDRAIVRRETVLAQMKKYDVINQAQFDSLRIQPIDLSHFGIRDHNIGLARHFREYLRGKLSKWCKTHYKADGTPYNIYKDGLRVYTTLDSRLQTYAEEAVNEHLGLDLQPAFYRHWKGHKMAPFVLDEETADEQIEHIMKLAMKRSERYRRLRKAGASDDSIQRSFQAPVPMQIFSWKGRIDTVMTPMDSIRYYKFILQAGFMSMEPRTGYVKAYVGGPDYRFFKYDHVTYGHRQVGSTFKPFLYTLAMQEGEFSPCTRVANIPYSIDLPDGNKWEPRNDSKTMIGEMVPLKWALAHSNNWISAFLMKRYKPRAVVKMARKMGVTSKIPAVPSIALGSADISLYEMVGGMNTFVNKGVYIEPVFITRIEDKNGNLIESFVPAQHEAMSEETAYLMVKLMQGVVETGTGRRLRFKYGLRNPIAGKTGTTQNQSDGWFMGLTPDLVSGVWVGCEDRAAHFRTIGLGQGANMALPIWALYMTKAYADTSLNLSRGDFMPPRKPLSVEIDCDLWDQQHMNNSLFGEDEEF